MSPIQKLSGHPTGPVLLAKDYLDAPSLRGMRDRIAPGGYLPGNPFNRVIDRALGLAWLARTDIYITQVFAAIKPAGRSASVPVAHRRASFEAVGQHELKGRRVLALGPEAARICAEFGVPHVAVASHPSARGPGMTDAAKAEALAAALTS